MNRNDANARTVSKSILYDLEDAKGKLWRCVIQPSIKPAVPEHMESLQVIWIPLSQDEGNPLEVIVPPSMLIIVERRGNLQWKTEIRDLKWRGIPCLPTNNINYVWLKTIKVVAWRSVSLLNIKINYKFIGQHLRCKLLPFSHWWGFVI